MPTIRICDIGHTESGFSLLGEETVSLLEKWCVLQKCVGKSGVCLLYVMKTGDQKLVC